MPRKLSGLGGEGTKSSLDFSGNGLGGLGAEDTLKPPVAGAEDDAKEQEVESVSTPEEEAVVASELVDPYSATPREMWEEELKDAEMSTSEAAAILDSIMTTGRYEETYKMGGVQFKLKTRTTVDADRTIEILQDLKPEVSGVYNHIISRINLAASLVSYGNQAFSHTDPADDNRETLDSEWRIRYRFCSTLPAPAFYALTQVLQRFEGKVGIASDPRSLENF